MDAKDWNGHTPATDLASPSLEAHEDVMSMAGRAIYEIGKMHGRLEAALERIGELQAQVDASRGRM